MNPNWCGSSRFSRPLASRTGETAVHAAFLRSAEAAAPSLGLVVSPANVHDAAEIERAITAFAAEPNGGLIVMPHPVAVSNRDLIIGLAARHRLPAVYPLTAGHNALRGSGPGQ